MNSCKEFLCSLPPACVPAAIANHICGHVFSFCRLSVRLPWLTGAAMPLMLALQLARAGIAVPAGQRGNAGRPAA